MRRSAAIAALMAALAGAASGAGRAAEPVRRQPPCSAAQQLVRDPDGTLRGSAALTLRVVRTSDTGYDVRYGVRAAARRHVVVCRLLLGLPVASGDGSVVMSWRTIARGPAAGVRHVEVPPPGRFALLLQGRRKRR